MPGWILSRKMSVALLVAISFAVFLAFALLRFLGVLQSLELTHYDFALSSLADQDQTPDVVIVAVEEADLGVWGWPLSDLRLAQLAQAALDANAKVVGIDIYRDRSVQPGSEDLNQVLQDARVITIAKLSQDGGILIQAPAQSARAGTFGFSDVPLDVDGVARRTLLVVTDGEELRLSFPMKIAMTALGYDDPKPNPDEPETIMFGNTPIARLSTGFGSYSGLDATGYQIMTRHEHKLPVAPIFNAGDVLDGTVPKSALEGKVVLIGLISETIKDHFETPVNRYTGARFVHGLQLHAAVVQQLLDHASDRLRPVSDVSTTLQNVLIALASLIGAAIALFVRGGALTILVGLAGAMLVLVGMSATLTFGVWLPAVPVTLAWLASFSISFAIVSIAARRQRSMMSKLFQSQLSPELSQEIWQQREKILVGGKPVPRKLNVSLLYADIAGSTRVSGIAKPEDFVKWISTVLDALGADAARHKGFVEKYTGDGILVAFGAPLPDPGETADQANARAACNCALAMRETIRRLNAKNVTGWPYHLRVGLHCGEVFGGAIGGSHGMKYNLIGNTVNTAARIESFGKQVKDRHDDDVTVCCSEEYAQLLGEFARLEHAGELLHDDGRNKHKIFLIKDLL
ncbi:adenylate/guanylate cyclase domain-containing protein [Roseibium sp. MMSF_3544]|uniref:CHASE2 domain-containing protein n=1 Tax=unclassified Roseibium TaxID=2629323 RepID=UPI00273D4D65|nr:adenylate/guanylate cyclase domain-containing protein [Roseibium sp. MMSF_3544]